MKVPIGINWQILFDWPTIAGIIIFLVLFAIGFGALTIFIQFVVSHMDRCVL